MRPQRAPQWPCRCEAASAAAATDYRQRRPADVRVLVVGATGYIGKYVVRELVRRGYDVVALARERSGIGGKASREDAQRVRPAADPFLPIRGYLLGRGAQPATLVTSRTRGIGGHAVRSVTS